MVQRKHKRLAQGYVTRLNHNGIFERVPHRHVRISALAPLAILVVALFLFKALLLSQLGPETYAAHVSALAGGNTAERLGAIVMTADPLTEALARLVATPF